MSIMYIAVGILLLLIGIVLRLVPTKKDATKGTKTTELTTTKTRNKPYVPPAEPSEKVTQKIQPIANENTPQSIIVPEVELSEPSDVDLTELQALIDLAMADGHISPNERKLIIQKSKDLNIPATTVERSLLVAEAAYKGKKEVKLIDQNKEAGDQFEQFIAEKVHRNSKMKLHAWQGDKGSNGVYSETTKNPDIHVKWGHGNMQADFAIECKYRSSLYNGKFELPSRKYTDYSNFSSEQKMPVFIAIGIGGEPSNPNSVYLVPLITFENGQVQEAELSPFKMNETNGNLYYGFFDKTLRETNKEKRNG